MNTQKAKDQNPLIRMNDLEETFSHIINWYVAVKKKYSYLITFGSKVATNCISSHKETVHSLKYSTPVDPTVATHT